MDEYLLAPFHAAPQRSGIFMDFDGTLSHIVELPGDARPAQGAREVLRVLGHMFAVVAVVSGRSASQLLEWLGEDVEIWGVHGAERVSDGRVVLSPIAEEHRELMARVLEDAKERVADLGIPGVLVEDKTAMVNLHYRAAEDTGRAGEFVHGIASALAEDHGLRMTTGRLTYELAPPIRFSKEDVVLTRARQARLEAVLFIGDDTVDIPAFAALDVLASEGAAAVRVAVESLEAPQALIERADILLSGPDETVRFLESLANPPE